MSDMRDPIQVFYSGVAPDAAPRDEAGDPVQSFYSGPGVVPGGRVDLSDPMQTFYSGSKLSNGVQARRDRMQLFYAAEMVRRGRSDPGS